MSGAPLGLLTSIEADLLTNFIPPNDRWLADCSHHGGHPQQPPGCKASYKSEPGHKCPTENLGQLKGCFLFARQVAWKAFGLVSTGISEEWLECCQLQLPIATVRMRKYSGISSRKAFSFFRTSARKNAATFRGCIPCDLL